MEADTPMKRLHELEEENKRLKSLLAEHGIPFKAYVHDCNLTASQFSNSTDSTITVTSVNTNVQNVLTGSSLHYHTNISSTTLQAKMPMVGMLLAYIRC